MLQARIRDLLPWVEEARGLRLLQPVDVEVLTVDEMTARNEEWVTERGRPASLDLLPALFGIDEESEGDALAPLAVTYSDGVIRVPEPLAGGVPNAILVHELVHALTDQHLRYSDSRDALLQAEEYGDSYSALSILVEGDASFIAGGYAFQEAIGGAWTPEGSICPGFWPSAEGAGMSWYTLGESYVCRLFQQGGWGLVNAAYQDRSGTTAGLLGISCDVGGGVPTVVPTGWDVLLDYSEGALSFLNSAALHGVDTHEIRSWCGDRLRLLESPTGVLLMTWEIWVAEESDAIAVHEAAVQFFENPASDVKAVFATDARWIGIASTLSDLPMCELLASWCA